MSNAFKVFSLLIVGVLMACLLAGCGKTYAPGSSSATEIGEPTVTIVSPSDGLVVPGGQIAPIAVTASVQSGANTTLQSLTLSINGIAQTNLQNSVAGDAHTFQVPVSALADGAYVIKITAINSAGKENSASITVNVSTSSNPSAPQITLTPAPGTIVDDQVDVAAQVVSSKPLSYVTISINGASAKDMAPAETEKYTYSFSMKDLGIASAYIEVRAANEDGESLAWTAAFLKTDTPPPATSVWFANPKDGQEISGTIPIVICAATAQPNVNAELQIISNETTRVMLMPTGAGLYTHLLDTTKYNNGQITLKALVNDAMAEVNPIISNPAAPPVDLPTFEGIPIVKITAPADRQVVSGYVAVRATVNFASPRRVELFVNGALQGAMSGSGTAYARMFNSAGYTGNTDITVKVWDKVGETEFVIGQDTITVDVNNIAPPAPTPSIRFVSPKNKDKVSGIITVKAMAENIPIALPTSVKFYAGEVFMGNMTRNSSGVYSYQWDTSLPELPSTGRTLVAEVWGERGLLASDKITVTVEVLPPIIDPTP